MSRVQKLHIDNMDINDLYTKHAFSSQSTSVFHLNSYIQIHQCVQLISKVHLMSVLNQAMVKFDTIN